MTSRLVCALAMAAIPAGAATVFEENFNSYKDGEQPTSIAEQHGVQLNYGEVVGGRFAVNYGNRYLLLAPKVKDFALSFTAQPYPRGERAPTMSIDFCATPEGSKGYSLVHWILNEWNRLDFYYYDYTASPPVRRLLAQPKVPRLPWPVTAPIRFKLNAHGRDIVFTRNDEVLLKYTETNADVQVVSPGTIAFAAWHEYGSVSPMYFDDFRLDTSDPVAPAKAVYNKTFDGGAWMRANHLPLVHTVRISEVKDTGMDAMRADAPSGLVYRVDADINFPTMIKGYRSMGASTPYVRIERTDGEPLLEQPIFSGILGNLVPGAGTSHGGGGPQLVRLMTSYDVPPHYGAAIRHQAAADATGPQSSTRYLTGLPDDFNVVAGWEFFLDTDHIENCGPVETIYRKNGQVVYTGMPLKIGDRALLLDFPVSPGMVARVSTNNLRYKAFVDSLKANPYFLEGEPVTFTVSLAAGPRTSTPAEARWRLLDAFRQPVKGGEGTLALASATNTLAVALRSAGRETVSAALPLGVKPPGVYWLDIDAGGTTLQRVFSIVPKEQREGNTAALASGLPCINGAFMPLSGWVKECGHYVSLAGPRDADDLEVLRAYNLQIMGAPGVAMPPVQKAFVASPRLWMPGSFKTNAIQAFLESREYRPQPGDERLRDPKTPESEAGRIIREAHFKEWIDHWCAVRAANEAAERASWDKYAPSRACHHGYGPPLINSYYYGNLYNARYYGWDARMVKKLGRWADSYQMEAYAYDFGREPESYTPSIALTRLAIPELLCRWELYGAGGYVDDYRTNEGCAPHGLHYPSPNFMAHQAAELSLAPWTFDGKTLHPAGNTHMAPGFGEFTKELLIGMVDGLRAAGDVKSLAPVRSPAFVDSWAAADLDPSWKRGGVNNSAAEAPAYAYLQSRLAGLAGGFFLDIADVGKLDRHRADMLVLPSMRGATPEQVAAIRKQYAAGMALVCFDDATGLEDLFGIRRLPEPVAVSRVERAAGDTLLTGLGADVVGERVGFGGKVWYELAGATEVLSCTDSDNRRVAPMLTLHRPANKPGALFFAAGASEVARRASTFGELTSEGEVLSKLVRHAVRRGLLAVADPVVQVTPPATVLAFRRPDGNLHVVVMEASFPFSIGKPVEVELTLRGPGAETARLECERPLRERPGSRGERHVTLTLQPDEVVPMSVSGLRLE